MFLNCLSLVIALTLYPARSRRLVASNSMLSRCSQLSGLLFRGSKRACFNLYASLTLYNTLTSTSKANTLTTSSSPGLLEAYKKLQNEQEKIYAKVIIAGKKFTVTKNDTVFTHRMKNVNVADVIQLSKCLEIGTPSYTLRNADNFLSTDNVTVLATVISHARGQKIHRKIVKRRKIQYPSKNLKPHITVLRIKHIGVRI